MKTGVGLLDLPDDIVNQIAVHFLYMQGLGRYSRLFRGLRLAHEGVPLPSSEATDTIQVFETLVAFSRLYQTHSAVVRQLISISRLSQRVSPFPLSFLVSRLSHPYYSHACISRQSWFRRIMYGTLHEPHSVQL